LKMHTLGSDGPEISVVGFGAWEAGGMAWGPNPPDEQTINAMQAGLDNGLNWIDTAEVYGGGRSEELVGRAVRDRPNAMVFTKVAPKPAGSGFRPEEVRRAAQKSLKRLGRDRIDLLQLHWRDDSVPVEETWGAMTSLVEEGLVRHIGVSNFDRELIDRCEAIRHVDSLQPQFSMLHQRRRELFTHCASQGTGVICYGPLAYGLLTGAITKDTEFSDDDWRSGKHGMSNYYNALFAPGVKEKHLDKVDALKKVAERIGITLAQLALAWVWHQDGVTGAIAGSRSPDHVAENAGAGDVSLSASDLEEIDAIVS
jgi:aryl-alcohol dehydrogenase-like predicted oxidoreductase